MLPTFVIEKFLTGDEINHLVSLIKLKADKTFEDTSTYFDSGVNGKYSGKIVSNNYNWDYHNTPEIEKILTAKIEQAIGKKLKVVNAHILESLVPYQLHTDVIYQEQQPNPEYTLLIPVDNFASHTVVFNESWNHSNDFEDYKKQYTGKTKLQLDPKFCAEYLSHLHPADLRYLTLQTVFPWKQGSLLAFDRRHFHCSDNYSKRGTTGKIAIILRTHG